MFGGFFFMASIRVLFYFFYFVFFLLLFMKSDLIYALLVHVIALCFCVSRVDIQRRPAILFECPLLGVAEYEELR